jgi:hypothetical protein
MLTIFIDESGTLPDPKDKFIIICGVGVRKIKEAENIFSRISASLRKRKIKIKEIKFYYAGENTKRQFLSGIVSANFDIFALIVNKKERKIADTPENFVLLVAELINEINLWYKTKEINLVIDRHFYRKIDHSKFNQFLRTKINNSLKCQIKHVDSQNNFLVNIADMAAGAILWRYSGKNLQFYNLIKDNIIIEKIMSWPEIKRRSIIQNKKLT